MNKLIASAFLAAAFAAPPTSAEVRIAPARPSAFERVNLRMTVDSCVFDPSRVRVSLSPGTAHILVAAPRNHCLVPGETRVADILLGAFPPGAYTVSVHDDPGSGAAYERASFTVADLPVIAIFPAPARPLTNYSGQWWNPLESGWGLAIEQGVSNTLFGAWFVYGPGGQPEWYTLQGGQWTSSTRWTGVVYRTMGPYFGGPFTASTVLAQAVGTATLDFTQVPGGEDRARFTYSVGEVTATKTITRMAF